MDTIDIEDIGEKFFQVVSSAEWKEFQEKYNKCNDIYVIGHGGNLAVADHTAIDLTRLSMKSNTGKNAVSPSSAVVVTSLINDSSFEDWIVQWLEARTRTRTPEQIKNSLVYAISSSGTSIDSIKALQWASKKGMQTVVLTGQPLPVEIDNLTQVVLETKYYHTGEVLALLLQYQLTHGSGATCPAIPSMEP